MQSQSRRTALMLIVALCGGLPGYVSVFAGMCGSVRVCVGLCWGLCGYVLASAGLCGSVWVCAGL